eukprot:1148073-Pelagomonas_calceolata.AAC.25
MQKDKQSSKTKWPGETCFSDTHVPTDIELHDKAIKKAPIQERSNNAVRLHLISRQYPLELPPLPQPSNGLTLTRASSYLSLIFNPPTRRVAL